MDPISLVYLAGELIPILQKRVLDSCLNYASVSGQKLDLLLQRSLQCGYMIVSLSGWHCSYHHCIMLLAKE